MNVQDIVLTVGELYLKVKELSAQIEYLMKENKELSEKIQLLNEPAKSQLNLVKETPNA